MRITKRALEKIKAYIKSRKSIVRLYGFTSTLDYNGRKDLSFVEIKNYAELIQFSKGQNNALNNLLNKECESRFKRGSILYLAMLQDSWVAYGWLACEGRFWIAEIDTAIDTAGSQTGVLYDFFTREDLRCQGIYASLLRFMTINASYKRYVCYCYEANKSSANGMLKGGAEYLGQLTHSSCNRDELFRRYGMKMIGSRLKVFGLLYNKQLGL